MSERVGVAEAKRRFSELIDRVRRGERFLVVRRGTPVVGLVPPHQVGDRGPTKPVGLAAVAGALADWEELEAAVDEIYRARQRSKDRPAPDLA